MNEEKEKIVNYLNTFVVDNVGETRPYIDPDNIECIAEGIVKLFDLADVGETFNECTTQVGMNRCTSCGSMYCDGNICT